VHCGGESCNLGAAQYPGSLSPLVSIPEEFRLDPFPTGGYHCGIEKTVFLVQGQQTVVIQYSTASRCRSACPLLAFRDYHSLQHCNDSFHKHRGRSGFRLS